MEIDDTTKAPSLISLKEPEQANPPLKDIDQYLHDPSNSPKPYELVTWYKYVALPDRKTGQPILRLAKDTPTLFHAQMAQGDDVFSAGRCQFANRILVEREHAGENEEAEAVFNFLEKTLHDVPGPFQSYTLVLDAQKQINRIEVDKKKTTSRGSVLKEALENSPIEGIISKQIAAGQIRIFDNSSTGYGPSWADTANAIEMLSENNPLLFHPNCVDFAHKKAKNIAMSNPNTPKVTPLGETPESPRAFSSSYFSSKSLKLNLPVSASSQQKSLSEDGEAVSRGKRKIDNSFSTKEEFLSVNKSNKSAKEKQGASPRSQLDDNGRGL